MTDDQTHEFYQGYRRAYRDTIERAVGALGIGLMAGSLLLVVYAHYTDMIW